MRIRSGALLGLCAVLMSVAQLGAGTVGSLVSVRGHLADIEYDWRRQVVYGANFSANRIEVYSMADKKLQAAIPVAEMPSTLAISGDQRFLVVGHKNGTLTINDLDANQRRTVTLPEEILAVGFGSGQFALVVTPTQFHRLDPLSGNLLQLSLNAASAEKIPVGAGTYPPQITRASAGVSGDGESVYFLTQAGGENGVWLVRWKAPTQSLDLLGYTTSPQLGPRQVSVNREGNQLMAGWARMQMEPRPVLIAQLPNNSGRLDAGTIAFDWRRNVIYAQAELAADSGKPTPSQQPVLHLLDTDNLTVRERILVPRFGAGRSVFTPGLGTMITVADGGFMIFDLDQLHNAPRVVPSVEQLYFQGEGPACGSAVVQQTFEISDPNGQMVDFKLSLPSDVRGIRITQSSGTTPATVTVEVDLSAFQYQKGTASIPLTISSQKGVNLPPPVRLLINAREPEQRGRVLSVAGKLVDIAPDPQRGRFYVLRQDKNQVLVFDANTQQQIGTMRTGNTPVQMAISADRRNLLVTNENSQIINVLDLDNLQATNFIELPFGRYAHSVTATARAVWATARNVGEPVATDCAAGAGGGNGELLRLDISRRFASVPSRLGMFCNAIDPASGLTTSPSGGTALLVQPSGQAMVYESASDNWVAGRKDFPSLGGAYAALEEDLYLVGNNILDTSLVPLMVLDATAGTPSGAATIPGNSYIRTASNAAGYGYLERIDLQTFPASRTTRLTEAPLSTSSPAGDVVGFIGQYDLGFTRTLTYVPAPETLVSLSTSGLQILPLTFDDAVTVAPIISAVTNSADFSANVAPGGLITIRGSQFSSVTESAGMTRWPTALGEVCVILGGNAIPLGYVSPTEIRGQIPFGASAGILSIQSAGGKSESFNLPVLPAAPAIFHSGSAGPMTGIATVVRKKNNELVTASNPIHPEDELVIYLTGMGDVSPAIESGVAAPADPASGVVIAPQVALGSTNLDVQFAGTVAGKIGVYRIDVKVPFRVNQTGWEVPLTINQGGSTSQLLVRVIGN